MSAPVQPGDMLAGKYRVERILGQGGMGVVVAAEHVELGEKVALKFMLSAAVSNPANVERFTREARAAAKLKTEHVARVTDVGRLDDGSPYIVMEYLEGHDLGAELTAKGVLGPEVIDYILQACVAVAEAHRHRIVHRDLKPENLFVTQRADGSPLVKVLDFGISKLLADAGDSTTKTASAMGSPAYMAPEQMKSAKHVDERADLWSLGAILYHALSGSLPFSAETVPEMFAMVLTEPHTPLLAVAPQIPPGLAQAVEGCLVKDPDARVQSVAQLANLLSPFASPVGQAAARSVVRISGVYAKAAMPDLGALDSGAGTIPRMAVTTHRAASGQVLSPGSVTATGSSADRRRGTLGIAAAAVLLIGVGVLTFTRNQGSGEVDGDDAVTVPAAASPGVAPGPAAASKGPPLKPEPTTADGAADVNAAGQTGDGVTAAEQRPFRREQRKRRSPATAEKPTGSAGEGDSTASSGQASTTPPAEAPAKTKTDETSDSATAAAKGDIPADEPEAKTKTTAKKHPCEVRGWSRDSETCVEYERKKRRARRRKQSEKDLFGTMQ